MEHVGCRANPLPFVGLLHHAIKGREILLRLERFNFFVPLCVFLPPCFGPLPALRGPPLWYADCLE